MVIGTIVLFAVDVHDIASKLDIRINYRKFWTGKFHTFLVSVSDTLTLS